jgi:hypothetical protein
MPACLCCAAQVTEGRERELRVDLDSLQGRHVELKRKFRSLYLAYRQVQGVGGGGGWGWLWVPLRPRPHYTTKLVDGWLGMGVVEVAIKVCQHRP